MNQQMSEEYKKSILLLYMNGKPIEEIVSAFGAVRSTFYRWLRRYREIKLSEDEVMTADDIRALQLKVARLEEKNLILKKAMAIFTRDSRNELTQSDDKILNIKYLYYAAKNRPSSNRKLENDEYCRLIWGI